MTAVSLRESRAWARCRNIAARLTPPAASEPNRKNSRRLTFLPSVERRFNMPELPGYEPHVSHALSLARSGHSVPDSGRWAPEKIASVWQGFFHIAEDARWR